MIRTLRSPEMYMPNMNNLDNWRQGVLRRAGSSGRSLGALPRVIGALPRVKGRSARCRSRPPMSTRPGAEDRPRGVVVITAG